LGVVVVRIAFIGVLFILSRRRKGYSEENIHCNNSALVLSAFMTSITAGLCFVGLVRGDFISSQLPTPIYIMAFAKLEVALQII
jgi:hypothetical protein